MALQILNSLLARDKHEVCCFTPVFSLPLKTWALNISFPLFLVLESNVHSIKYLEIFSIDTCDSEKVFMRVIGWKLRYFRFFFCYFTLKVIYKVFLLRSKTH